MNGITRWTAMAAVVLVTGGALVPVRAGAEAIIEALRATYDFDKGIELAFDLETYWAVREKTRKRSGSVVLGPDDRFRAEIGKTVWVCDGRTYWQYNAKTNQVVIKQLLDIDLSMHPSQIVKAYLTEYDFTVKEVDGKRAVLEGVRASEDTRGREQTVTLWVDTKKNTITKAVSVDKQGNRNTYTFTKTRLAVGANPGTFQFEIPEGAEVLDTR
jgi:outer membrane lipoprotein-sorting protein